MKTPEPKFNLKEPKAKKPTLIIMVVRFDNQRLSYCTGEQINPAYNLMSLYKHVTTQTQSQQRLHTIRINCFAVGSWIVKQGNKKILKLAVRMEKRAWMDGLLKLARDVTIPLSLKT